MRAIVIDPFTATVAEIGDLGTGGIRETIFGQGVKGSLAHHSLGAGITAIVDDAGLLRGNRSQRYFHFTVFRPAVAMAGRAVLVAMDDHGDLVGLPWAITTDQVRSMVAFVGDDGGLEAAIRAGAVRRPSSIIATDGGKGTARTLWEWRPALA